MSRLDSLYVNNSLLFIYKEAKENLPPKREHGYQGWVRERIYLKQNSTVRQFEEPRVSSLYFVILHGKNNVVIFELFSLKKGWTKSCGSFWKYLNNCIFQNRHKHFACQGTWAWNKYGISVFTVVVPKFLMFYSHFVLEPVPHLPGPGEGLSVCRWVPPASLQACCPRAASVGTCGTANGVL